MSPLRASSALLAAAALCTAAAGCAPTLKQRELDAAGTLEELADSRFEAAGESAARLLERDGGNPYAAAVAAISEYKATVHDLVNDVITVVVGAAATGRVNDRYLEGAFRAAEASLAKIDARLAIAAAEPGLAIELCVACLDVDWNRDGRIDDDDEAILEVELDEEERPIPEGDPRRRPTFRFDHGDFLWARAFVAFQRAALDIVIAYEWSDLARAARFEDADVRIRLVDEARMAEAKRRILEGLDLSDAAREAYLAETDDDREWLPNPRQEDHPMPMPVDAALYETWARIAGDVRQLVRGEEGLDVAEIAQLGDNRWKNPPRGFIDLGRLFDDPHDIVLDAEALDDIEDAADDGNRRAVETALDGLLGSAYVRKMPRSPLPSRLVRMQREIDRGVESVGRKLRYLLWIN
ncbi:MAG: hypothetical protein M0R80_19580 [Proteobacteria bacterium]|nr:hypothetical protein [Pseudomonadota bacterium]